MFMKTYQKSARLNCNFEYEGHYNHNYNCNYTFHSNTPPAAPAIPVLTIGGGSGAPEKR